MIVEYSDGFDAVAWHQACMERDSYDPYYDEDDDQ